MVSTLNIENLWVFVGEKAVVRDVSLNLHGGELYVLMGPNGAGKSSLAHGIMGHKTYKVKGRIYFNNNDITNLPTHERVRMGITLAHQNPPEIEGLKVDVVLKKMTEILRLGISSKYLTDILLSVGLSPEFLRRDLFVGMSGGERKKLELARVLIQKPKVALLDEPDSGVDISSLPLVAKAIGKLVSMGSAVLLITHQLTTLNYLNPKKIFVMIKGEVVASGGKELIDSIINEGYEGLIKR